MADPLRAPDSSRGPLTGTKIVELAGIGPGPFAGMMLADLGATVVTIDRLGGNPFAASSTGHDVLFRGRSRLEVDLKSPDGVETVLELCETSDALIEGFRPGVVERLGIGPDQCLARNPRLVYGRITGWGQDGPLARTAGHDLNYIALSGALDSIGTAEGGPVVPLNLIGDFGGGGMLLALGVVSAILHARSTGQGDVVDAAMVDGASLLMSMFYAQRAAGTWGTGRGSHQLDGGAHYYNVYRTADGRWISIGALEPQFYAEFCDVLDLDEEIRTNQLDQSRWPEFTTRVQAVVERYTRDQLEDLFAGRDACFSPVLSMDEVAKHPHNAARGTFTFVDGYPEPRPAPRFRNHPFPVASTADQQ